MSVNKDKTLAKVRTFAQDFAAHQGTDSASSARPENKEASPETKAASSAAVKKETATHQAAAPRPTLTVKDRSKKIAAIAKTVQTPSKKSSPTKIPSFHELEKSADHKAVMPQPSTAVKQKRRSTLAKGDTAATVITATKKAGQKSQRKSIATSLSEWFKKLFKKKKTNKNTYTVGDTVHRKGVIQKATTKSGSIFTADNQTLREEILRRRKTADQELEISWSPNTETTYQLLDSPHNEEVITEPEETTPLEPAVVPQPVDDLREEITVPASEPDDTRWENPVESDAIEAPSPEPIIETPPTEPKQQDKEEDQEEISEVPHEDTQPIAEAIDPEPAPSQISVSPLQSVRALLRGRTEAVNPTAVALAVATGVAVLFVSALIIQNLVSLLAPNSVEIVTPTSSAIIVDAPVLELVVANPSEREEIITVLTQALPIASFPEQEVRLITSTGSAIAPETISQTLGWRIGPALSGSVESIHFVVIDNVQMGVIFSVTDQVSALGGMLQWEENLLYDLTPSLTLVESASEPMMYADSTVGPIDVRFLSDGAEDLLVYGFVNESTLVITRNTGTFIRLVR